VSRDRWDTLTPEQKKKFPPLCPDFVVELRSVSDALEDLQLKMQEYVANGIRLGWLIDPETQQVEVYRPEQEVQILQSPTTLSGETELPGLILDLNLVMSVD
jgi:Uma2 family endonuclease